jgi:hypothetical protein
MEFPGFEHAWRRAAIFRQQRERRRARETRERGVRQLAVAAGAHELFRGKLLGDDGLERAVRFGAGEIRLRQQ